MSAPPPAWMVEAAKEIWAVCFPGIPADVMWVHCKAAIIQRHAPAPEREEREPALVPMIIHCPTCSARHIDRGEFATKPHHTHACQHCGMVWRPAIGPTVGVEFLPGFKDADGYPEAHAPASPTLADHEFVSQEGGDPDWCVICCMRHPAAAPEPLVSWPDPTPEMLERPDFEAVWQAIKFWDINVPHAYQGYMHATGNHVRAILDALAHAPAASGQPANDDEAIRQRIEDATPDDSDYPEPAAKDRLGAMAVALTVDDCAHDAERPKANCASCIRAELERVVRECAGYSEFESAGRAILRHWGLPE